MRQRILAAVDGSETSRRALNVALDEAKRDDAWLRVVYVLSDPPTLWDMPGYDPSPAIGRALAEEGALVRREAGELLRQHAVRGDAVVVNVGASGDVAEAIVKAAADWHADLLVLGTHGRRGVRRLFLGSVAEHCVRLATLPVLLVPSHRADDKQAAS